MRVLRETRAREMSSALLRVAAAPFSTIQSAQAPSFSIYARAPLVPVWISRHSRNLLHVMGANPDIQSELERVLRANLDDEAARARRPSTSITESSAARLPGAESLRRLSATSSSGTTAFGGRGRRRSESAASSQTWLRRHPGRNFVQSVAKRGGVLAFSDWAAVSRNVDPALHQHSSLYAESILLRSAAETTGFLLVVCSVDSGWAQLTQKGSLVEEFAEAVASTIARHRLRASASARQNAETALKMQRRFLVRRSLLHRTQPSAYATRALLCELHTRLPVAQANMSHELRTPLNVRRSSTALIPCALASRCCSSSRLQRCFACEFCLPA